METQVAFVPETIALTEKKVAMALGFFLFMFMIHLRSSHVSGCLIAHDNIYVFLS